jgi:uncharacterized membrane protein (UPF0127 family)
MRFIIVALLGLLIFEGVHPIALPEQPTAPQPKLPTEPITITTAAGARYVFTVELPTTPAEQATGMMFRTNIPAKTGMLFVFAQPHILNFWMKNCPVPEDMLFIDQTGQIQTIAKNTTPDSLAFITSAMPAIATLELKGGITDQLGITAGDLVSAPQFNRHT